MSEPFPCPECGAMQLVHTVEDCQLSDGMIIKQLRHFKCQKCGARFFDDDAIHRIQAERTDHDIARAV